MNSYGILLLAVLIQLSLAGKYDYSSSSGKGPDKWASLFPNYCSKSSQSPVDIVVSKTNYDEKLGSITFTGYSTIPMGETLTLGNNGHSYYVSVKPKTFSISSGGLSGTYYLDSFHLHWGAVDTRGSEHTVDGKKYPAELHLVHMNDKYSTLADALKQSDGLAVLGIFLSVGSENAALESFLKYAANTTEPNSKLENVTQTHKLMDLLPEKTGDFYRYTGSLTTPDCNEVVTWTVFKNAATISAAQLTLLRDLKENNTTKMVDNYRPVQNLNSRTIKASYTAFSGAYQVTNFVEVVMGLVLVTLFKLFQ